MKPTFLYVMGAETGVGKSTVCLGLLAYFLSQGFKASQLAYIKPMTQCITPQKVALFCEKTHIDVRATDGLVFSKGFTRDFIAGLTRNSAELKQDILASINDIAQHKAIVIIDGIGHPAVGSVIGVSNVDIALALECSVIYIAHSGIGKTIDSTVLNITFMQSKGINKIGVIFNQLSDELMTIQPSINKRVQELLPTISILGFLTKNQKLDELIQNQSINEISDWFVGNLNAALLLEH
jgi:dethiobiotin synthetase